MLRGVSISHQNGKRIVKGLGYYTPERVENFRHLVKSSVQKYGNKVGFKFKDKKGNIVRKTYIEFDRDIDRLGTALCSLGLKGKHISIISENRYEWGVCYFSIVNGTGVAVPLDKYLPQNEVENLKEELEAYKGFDDAILSNLKAKGFTGDLEDIVLDLQTHSELIPFEGVLGGTMGFYSDKHIHLLTDKWVLAYFEDGHIFGFMLLEYDIKDGEIIWKVIDSYLF